MKNTTYEMSTIVKAGYVLICLLMSQTIASGKRIALARELKHLKPLMNPDNVDLNKDLDLLEVLEEPHVKLSSEMAHYLYYDILKPYAMINLLDDKSVIDDKEAYELGLSFCRRFIFCKIHYRRRERYTDLTKGLYTGQRAIFEWCKLCINGYSRVNDMSYKSNYSPGRLKALLTGSKDSNILLMEQLIAKLKNCEHRSFALTVL